VPKTTTSEGSSFAQKGGRGDKASTRSTFDKEYWKNKECFRCGEKGHPASSCTKDDDEDNNKSLASQAKSMKQIFKKVKSMKKAFTQLQQMREA
jgi:hypothetical protein